MTPDEADEHEPVRCVCFAPQHRTGDLTAGGEGAGE